tara:strand:- start:316 stop:840 length:525 start_codon:yes stop_codon:yes gene_type:complete
MTSTLKTDKIEGVTASGTVQMPAGHVVQTVYNNYSTQTVISNSGNSPVGANTFSDTGLTCSITPKFSTSKIYILTLQYIRLNDSSGNPNVGAGFKFFRDSTAIYTSATHAAFYHYDGDGNENDIRVSYPISLLDSPSTTSSITYKVQASKYGDGYVSAQHDGELSSMTLMEIAQ